MQCNESSAKRMRMSDTSDSSSTTSSSSSDSGSSMGHTINIPTQTESQLRLSNSPTAHERDSPLARHAISLHESAESGTDGRDDDFVRDPATGMAQGVNPARLQREIYLAINHIQSHMDKHYPGKFMFTIPDDNAYKVTSEFVAPFGWWQGACFKIEFDFSRTDKHNKGPKINVLLAPPVSHLFGNELCLAQAIPYSAFLGYWAGEEAGRYGSYNFDRVQQMMNIINFVIMDTDFFDEGAGAVFYPDPKSSADYLEHKYEKLVESNNLWIRREIKQHEAAIKESASCNELLDQIATEIGIVNKKAMEQGFSLRFEYEEQKVQESVRSGLLLTNAKPIDYKGYKFYSHGSLADCVYVSPIVIEPVGDWQRHLSGKNYIDILCDQVDSPARHRVDCFYPVLLDPQGRVSEFLITEITLAGDNDYYSLGKLIETLTTKLTYSRRNYCELTKIYFGNKEIKTDEQLKKVIDELKRNIRKNNTQRKKTNKLACIFVKGARRRYSSAWSAMLKPTKTTAKASNLASQFKLTISQETPLKTQRYRDGRQWGVMANAWLPVMDRDMANYEKLAIIKFLVDFAHKTLKLPNKREAVTACDANNIIMKSMTMTMVMALEKGEKWLPSQCFLDLMLNAINTQYEIGEFYADVKYCNLKMMFNCFSGKLDRKNLKDFAFLINYLIASLAQQVHLNDGEKNALIPRLMLNAFVEYLVRVLEREEKNPEGLAESWLDDEQSLTLDKIIMASKTGFSVVAHQLTILQFLSCRDAPLTKLEEHERENLQSRIKSVQQIVPDAPDVPAKEPFEYPWLSSPLSTGSLDEHAKNEDGSVKNEQSLSTDAGNYYGQLFNLLLAQSDAWHQPARFDSPEHQKIILQTVLDKFHQRAWQLSHQSGDAGSPLMDVDGALIPGQMFAVSDEKEYGNLYSRLNGQLEHLKLRKNVQVVEGGSKKYLHSCHYCGDHYTTSKPLYETKKLTKLGRIKRGFIYRAGKPIHWDCKAQRKSDTEKALRLISAIEENSYPYPQSLARQAKKVW